MDLSVHFRIIRHFDFSVVVFDTAPTGHTLRFLSTPNLFIKGLSKVQELKSKFGVMFSQVGASYVAHPRAYRCFRWCRYELTGAYWWCR